MGRVTLWPEVIQQVLHEQAACFVYILHKDEDEIESTSKTKYISFDVFLSVLTVCQPPSISPWLTGPLDISVMSFGDWNLLDIFFQRHVIQCHLFSIILYFEVQRCVTDRICAPGPCVLSGFSFQPGKG